MESLVKIKRKASLRVEFLIKKSKIRENGDIWLASRTKGIIKNGIKSLKYKKT